MNAISINDVTIYTINDNKYKKAGNSKFNRICKTDGCIEQVEYRDVSYCRDCINELTNGDK